MRWHGPRGSCRRKPPCRCWPGCVSTLPSMPQVAGTVGSDAFAAAVAAVAVAAGRDDALPVLTGIRVEIDGDQVTLATTDRYRLAVRTLRWAPLDPGMQATALVPARTLADAAKSLTAGA